MTEECEEKERNDSGEDKNETDASVTDSIHTNSLNHVTNFFPVCPYKRIQKQGYNCFFT